MYPQPSGRVTTHWGKIRPSIFKGFCIEDKPDEDNRRTEILL